MTNPLYEDLEEGVTPAALLTIKEETPLTPAVLSIWFNFNPTMPAAIAEQAEVILLRDEYGTHLRYAADSATEVRPVHHGTGGWSSREQDALYALLHMFTPYHIDANRPIPHTGEYKVDVVSNGPMLITIPKDSPANDRLEELLLRAARIVGRAYRCDARIANNAPVLVVHHRDL